MRRALALWACNVVALFVADELINGLRFDDAWVVVLAGAVLALVNWIVRPVVTILAIPLIILTLGIALFLIPLLMLYITSWIVSGFEVSSFGAAIAGAILIWLVNVVLQAIFGIDDRRARRRRERAA